MMMSFQMPLEFDDDQKHWHYSHFTKQLLFVRAHVLHHITEKSHNFHVPDNIAQHTAAAQDKQSGHNQNETIKRKAKEIMSFPVKSAHFRFGRQWNKQLQLQNSQPIECNTHKYITNEQTIIITYVFIAFSFNHETEKPQSEAAKHRERKKSQTKLVRISRIEKLLCRVRTMQKRKKMFEMKGTRHEMEQRTVGHVGYGMPNKNNNNNSIAIELDVDGAFHLFAPLFSSVQLFIVVQTNLIRRNRFAAVQTYKCVVFVCK